MLLLALLAWNCQKEEQQIPPNEGLHFLESKFSLEDFNDPFIKDNLKVNWDRYSKKFDSLSNTTIYAFETSVKGKLENDKKQFEYKYQVLGHKQGDTWAFGIVHILANNASSVEKVSYFEPESFSGTMHHYDLKGRNTKVIAFEQGELVGEITDMDYKGSIGESKEPPVSNEGVWVFITVKRYLDMYMYRGGGVYEYSYSVHNGTQHQWAFISTGGTHSTYGHEQGEVYHGHHAGPSAPANPPDNHDSEYVFEEHVHLEGEVSPCVKGILEKLQQKDIQNLTVPDIGQLAGTGHLSQGILDLFDSSGNYNLTFKVEQLGVNENGDELNGGTTPTIGGWKIKLDSDLVNSGTQLSIAKTIIHEAVHAYIGYQLDNYNPLNSDVVADLNSLYQKFKNENNSLNLTQHEFMSQYVDALAYSLAVWDNHRLSIDYYKMLSWGGLESSSAYQALSNKTNIQNAIQNERYNKVGAKSTKCP